jgi:hypothetical protein
MLHRFNAVWLLTVSAESKPPLKKILWIIICIVTGYTEEIIIIAPSEIQII